MRAVNLSVSGLCVWRGPGLLGENRTGGGGGAWAGWGELAEGLASSSTQSVCYAVPGLDCIYLC